ncbi:hypothetical protein NW762_013195 [Fusarium torreyae]|uniref:Uncharacterized protein n=1 Tax=Fusarium torreyae TaxID=1237075 RepID=A0A9W8RL89_9HYPO|nr:hypothetical protein NW762_013195 [Fusarium torreyae]
MSQLHGFLGTVSMESVALIASSATTIEVEATSTEAETITRSCTPYATSDRLLDLTSMITSPTEFSTNTVTSIGDVDTTELTTTKTTSSELPVSTTTSELTAPTTETATTKRATPPSSLLLRLMFLRVVLK